MSVINVREGGLFGGHYLEQPDGTVIFHKSDRFVDCKICKKLGYVEIAKPLKRTTRGGRRG